MTTCNPQLVLLGDSLIEQSIQVRDGFSFQAELQSYLIRRFDVVNRGLSGWNTKNVLNYLPLIFPTPSYPPTTESTYSPPPGTVSLSPAKPPFFFPKIDVLVRLSLRDPLAIDKLILTERQLILLGANDAAILNDIAGQHVDVEEYKENLHKIINHPGIKAHQPKILLVTPPPVDEIRLAVLDVGNGAPGAQRKSAVTATYAEKAREVAQEYPHVTLIDLWQAITDKAISLSPGDYRPGGPALGSPENGKQGALAQLLPDGLHMSGEAYKVFYDTLKPHVGENWKVEDKSGFIFPYWQHLPRNQ